MSRKIAEEVLPLLLCALPAIGQDRLVRETEAISPDQEIVGVTVAEGFEVRLFAAHCAACHRLRLADIANRETTALSLMPSTFGELLRPEEFRDLAAGLLGRK